MFPPPPGEPQYTLSQLLSVSCASATFCVAVGDDIGGNSTTGYIAQWDGTAWSVAATPGGDLSLRGVSCATTTFCLADCYAVGSDSAGATLIEHWDGVNWSLMPSPNPTGSVNSQLLDVVCPTTTTCHAVGVFARRTDGVFSYTLAERLA